MWFQHKSFKDSILSWWNQPQTQGWAAFRLQKKLLFIKEKLKIWNREVFGNIAQQKEILSQQIHHLDHKESDSGLTEEELGLRNKLKEEKILHIKKKSVGNKNPESIGSKMGITIQVSFTSSPMEEKLEISPPLYILTYP